MAELETLIEDIYGLFNKQEDVVANEEFLDQMGEAMKGAVREALLAQGKRGALRFSALGKPDRQLWYDEHLDPAEAEEMQPEAYIKFLYGHLIEAMVLFLAKQAGHDVSCEQEQVDVDGVKGHMDSVIDGVLVDVKSASPFSFKKFSAGELQPEDDAFGYIRQLSGYATVKGLPAAFLAIDKVSGKLCISPLSEYAIKGHPPAPRIEHLRGVLASDTPPPRCFPEEADGKSGNKKLGLNCSYCKWKFKCWDDANGGKGLRKFIYSTGPRFLTNVVREPDVYEANANG